MSCAGLAVCVFESPLVEFHGPESSPLLLPGIILFYLVWCGWEIFMRDALHLVGGRGRGVGLGFGLRTGGLGCLICGLEVEHSK